MGRGLWQRAEKEEQRFPCPELGEDDLNVTLDFCVGVYVMKID